MLESLRVVVLSRTLAVLWSQSEVAMAEGHIDGLLARVARGDADALAAVYDQVADPVYGLVRRIIKDEARSGQVTEEILLEVWRTASQFNPSAGSGLAWVIAIAQRHAVRAARPA